jgi:hypothetical protein
VPPGLNEVGVEVDEKSAREQEEEAHEPPTAEDLPKHNRRDADRLRATPCR